MCVKQKILTIVCLLILSCFGCPDSIYYGTTSDYGSSTTVNSSLVTSHFQTLSGLTANATYHFRVKSRDAAGNLVMSGDQVFKTAAAGAQSTHQRDNKHFESMAPGNRDSVCKRRQTDGHKSGRQLQQDLFHRHLGSVNQGLDARNSVCTFSLMAEEGCQNW